MNTTLTYSTIVCLIILAMVWLVRKWLEAEIGRLVQSRYESDLESLRSDLRVKETKLTGMQTHLLSGAASRLSQVDKKRLEALEHIWKDTLTLGSVSMPASLMQILKYDAFADQATTDSRFGELIAAMHPVNFKDVLSKLSGETYRIFVPEDVWSTFAAYKTIVIQANLLMEAVKIGVANPRKLFKEAEAAQLVKAVLPHQSQFVDEHSPDGVFFLLDEIRNKLLGQIRSGIAGDNATEQDAAQTSKIMKLVEVMNDPKNLASLSKEQIST